MLALGQNLKYLTFLNTILTTLEYYARACEPEMFISLKQQYLTYVSFHVRCTGSISPTQTPSNTPSNSMAPSYVPSYLPSLAPNTDSNVFFVHV